MAGSACPLLRIRVCSFTPPYTSSACKAVTLGGVRGGVPSDPKRVMTKLHVNWGHASARQIRRELVDSGKDNLHLLHHVGQELVRCEVCRAFGRSSHVPGAGTSTASTSTAKLQVGLSRSGEIIAPRVMDVFSEHSPLVPARPQNPQRNGAFSRARGSALLGHRSASSWMSGVTGRMRFGQIIAQGDRLSSFS